MCFTNTMFRKIEPLKKLKPLFEHPIYYANGFDNPQWPIQTPKGLQWSTWGLTPHWCTSSDQKKEINKQTLNARSETLFEKPAFQQAAQSQHCLVFSTGFFEFQARQGNKIPYFIQPNAGDYFLLAGIYDTWRSDSSGDIEHSFSIVTCPANTTMAEIHNTKQRMPVILNQEQASDWLSGGNTPPSAQHILNPCPDHWLKAHTVSKKMLKSNSPQSILPYDYPIQGSLF